MQQQRRQKPGNRISAREENAHRPEKASTSCPELNVSEKEHMRQHVLDKGITSEITMITSPRLKLRNPATVKSDLMTRTNMASATLRTVIVGESSKLSSNPESASSNIQLLAFSSSSVVTRTHETTLRGDAERNTMNIESASTCITPGTLAVAAQPTAGIPTMKDFCTNFRTKPRKSTRGKRINIAEVAVDTNMSIPETRSDPTKTGESVSASISTATTEGGLRVEIINGEIVIRQSSLLVGNTHRTIEEVDAEMDSEIVEDGPNANLTATYSSFTEREKLQQWTVEETRKFYEALRIFGVDFTTMAEQKDYFEGKRSRKQLKNKYKSECRRNPRLVDLMLRGDIQTLNANNTTSLQEHKDDQQQYLGTPLLVAGSSATINSSRSCVDPDLVSVTSQAVEIIDNASGMDKNEERVLFLGTDSHGLADHMRNADVIGSGPNNEDTLFEDVTKNCEGQNSSSLPQQTKTAVATSSEGGSFRKENISFGDGQDRSVWLINEAHTTDATRIAVSNISAIVPTLSLIGQTNTAAKKANKARIRPIAKKAQRRQGK